MERPRCRISNCCTYDSSDSSLLLQGQLVHFADETPDLRGIGRETTSHLQTNVEFKLSEVSSSAKFRVLTDLLPGVDMILGKPWLKNAGPAFNFEL